MALISPLSWAFFYSSPPRFPRQRLRLTTTISSYAPFCPFRPLRFSCYAFHRCTAWSCVAHRVLDYGMMSVLCDRCKQLKWRGCARPIIPSRLTGNSPARPWKSTMATPSSSTSSIVLDTTSLSTGIYMNTWCCSLLCWIHTSDHNMHGIYMSCIHLKFLRNVNIKIGLYIYTYMNWCAYIYVYVSFSLMQAWGQADANWMGRRAGVCDPVPDKTGTELHIPVHHRGTGGHLMVARSQLVAQSNRLWRYYHSP